jgi:hypothetical protein
LAHLLPGDGSLAERRQRWEDSIRVPTEQIEPIVTAVVKQARELTRDLVQLPDGEGIDLEIVREAPWLAYDDYLGDLHSTVSVNVAVPASAIELLVIALHEAYPGHHAERCAKEHLLVRGRGLLEETIVLAPTPQSLVTEGIGQLAPEMLLAGDGGPTLAAILHDAGVGFDLGHALAVHRALEPLRWAEVNAALMRHEAGASGADVQAYLQHWELMSEPLAAHLVRFLTDPASRTYVISYPAGYELCHAYVAGSRTGSARC